MPSAISPLAIPLFAFPPCRLARHLAIGRAAVLVLAFSAAGLFAQEATPRAPAIAPILPAELAPSASITGTVIDTDKAAIPSARVTLEDADTIKSISAVTSDSSGAFAFPSVAPGKYIVKIAASGFASWKIKDVIVLHEGEDFVIPAVELGVGSITTSVNAITMEDLAEQQITVEEHQRILGILPNFYVSYVPNAAAAHPQTEIQIGGRGVARSGDLLHHRCHCGHRGNGRATLQAMAKDSVGYAERYAATYGDRISSTFLGAALLPSLLHQDPRYFYRGHGKIIVRALYAISTVAVCKGDNGHWQPNYSNIGGNLGAAFISSLYYPQSDQHSVQVTVTNTLVGVGTGAFGVLFQEFLLRHLTHGVPKSP